MKSLPEKDFWNAIRNRLENYKEEPQDDWMKIAGAIPVSGQRQGNKPVNTGADLLSVISVVFLAWTLSTATPEAHSGTPAVVPELAAVDQADSLRAGRLEKQNESDNAPGQHVVQWHSNDQRYVEHDVADQSKRPGSANSADEQQWTAMTRGNDAIPDAAEVRITHISNDDMRQEEQVPNDSLQRDAVVKLDTFFFAVPPILQEKSKPRRKFRQSVYGVITPSFAYQKIVPFSDDNITIQKLNSEGLVSADRLGLNLEAGFQMQVSNAFELYAAISYYQQHQVISYNYVKDGDVGSVTDADKDWSYNLWPDEATRTFRYAMKNGGATAGVLYHIRGKKLMHKLGAGLQYQKGLITASGEYSYNNASSSYLNYQLLYRMEYSVGRRTSVFLQPQFVHSIVADEVLHEPFESKPYRVGVGFGLLYHFY